MLAASVAGFLALIDLLAVPVSSGPSDLLAVKPSDEEAIGLPSANGLVAFGVVALGIVLAIAALVALRRRPTQNRNSSLPVALILAAMVALVVAGVAWSLSAPESGEPLPGVAGGGHQAYRSLVQPAGLVILAAFFVSVAVMGIIAPRTLPAVLVLWLVFSLLFGFLGSSALAGLKLFEKSNSLGVPETFAAEVEKHRAPVLRLATSATNNWDVVLPLESGSTILTRDGSTMLLLAGVSAAPAKRGISNPLFQVTGATHTSFLRTATGDVYGNGEWTQLDPVAFQVKAGQSVPRGFPAPAEEGTGDEAITVTGPNGRNIELSSYRVQPDLLGRTAAVPASLHLDHISLSLAGDLETLEVGVLPTSATLLEASPTGFWRPYSGTFHSTESVMSYDWHSLVGEFSEDQLTGAGPVDDLTYYSLPEGLPERIRGLARDIAGGMDSPYAKARAIEEYLKREYVYKLAEPGEPAAQPAAGQDPVDWFLFDQNSGGSTSFSSAFVLLARAAEVPARVVSGWAIGPAEGTQAVHADQAHQWAEIALEGLGWITFDPTPGGAPTRVRPASEPEKPVAYTPQEVREQPEEQKPPISEGVALLQLATALGPEDRAEAALLLSENESDLALEGLVEALFDDPSDLVEDAALAALASWDYDLLVKILLEHENPEYRAAAAAALGELGDVRALQPLVQALHADVDAGVRAAAAEALGALGNAEAVGPLAQSLGLDTDASVRAVAAAALGVLGDESALEPLAQSLSVDPEPKVRAAAASALGEVRGPEALLPLLQARSEDESSAVRSAATAALDQYPLSELIEALLEGSSAAVKVSAAQLLGERGDPAAVPALIEALSDPVIAVQEAAMAALAQLGTITPLENGSALLNHSGGTSIIPGTTTETSTGLPHTPVFKVNGATNTRFLRTAVGDRYADGRWYAEDHTLLEYMPGSDIPQGGPPGQPTVAPEQRPRDRIIVNTVSGERLIPAGVAPVSVHVESLSAPGTFRPSSATFINRAPVINYKWTSPVAFYSPAQLNAAAASPDYSHASLPEGMPDRVRKLAEKITAGHSTHYARAKAIEDHLQNNYTYRLADPSAVGIPPDSDPVDWFLFESREGTCGNFSSAFVALARSVGLPARVVSGWAIRPMLDQQTVYADQAHQKAEVAFEGLGWVAFEPTGAGGPPGRAREYTVGPGQPESGQNIGALVGELSSLDPVLRGEARLDLEALGAVITTAENGGNVVIKDGVVAGVAPGTTTGQASQPPAIPVFKVWGAEHTRYLVSATGDVYENGNWRQLNPVALDNNQRSAFSTRILADEIAQRAGEWGSLPEWRVNRALLSPQETDFAVSSDDRIRVEAIGESGTIPASVVPIGRYPSNISGFGKFYPFSGTFYLAFSARTYNWSSFVPELSATQLNAAKTVSDPTYTQLPDGLPRRIKDLALRITAGHSTPYDKAKALDDYLSTRYTYKFADASGSQRLPPGHDPVDWFLFESREGTCGNFSSAFVVLARSIGIPARVISGWSISPTRESQTIKLDQAHQWAEVAFDEIGWVHFEPTAPEGPPSRALGSDYSQRRASSRRTQPSPLAAKPLPAIDTVTNITQWPARTLRNAGFTVGGTVLTATGRPVNDTEVEIFINETKEHGGLQIGSATAQGGVFRAEVQIPSSMTRGGYQLLAHAVGNDRFTESWSDPDITVFSQSGFELTGPSEVAVDAQAVFQGKVTEDNGVGVPSLELQVTIDGRSLPPQQTGPGGEFNFANTFSKTGPHWAEVKFNGKDLLRGNSVRLNFEVVIPTELSLDVPPQAPVGEEFSIKGVLRDIRGRPMAGEEVTITVGGNPELTVNTGDAGEFEATGSVDTAGEFAVQAEFQGERPHLSSLESSRLVARHLTALTFGGPGVVKQGEAATFHGGIASDGLPEIGPLSIVIEDGEGNRLETVTTGSDGVFEYSTPPLQVTGPGSLTARFEEHEHLTSSSASATFAVIVPTLIEVQGPSMARVGELVEFTGSLLRADGQPASGVVVWLSNPDEPLLTGQDGGFSRELLMESDLGGSSVEEELRIRFGFDGTAHLDRSSGNISITVGVPRITAEAAEPVARGGTATLRGAVFIGTRPLANAVISMEPELLAETGATGAFVLRYPVTPDAGLGTNVLTAAVSSLDIEAAIPVQIKSATNLVAVPLDDVRPGREVMLQAALYNDSGEGIAGAVVRTSQGVEATTDEMGTALIELTVPDSEDLLAVPVTFTYQGDDTHMPLTYFLGIPVTPSSFNWLLWVGLPVLLAVIAASGFGVKRLRAAGFPFTLPVSIPTAIQNRLLRRTPTEESAVAEPSGQELSGTSKDEPVPEPEETRLEIAFDKPVLDLPNVWGLNEEVPVTIRLLNENGQGLEGLPVEVQGPDGGLESLETGAQGNCGFAWTAIELGEFTVSVGFAGNGDYLASSDSGSFRVVDFREEIVRLYNSFVEWAGEVAPGISGQTPREVESMLVTSGMPLDQRALDEVISRFEEADYSEHSIAREQYEAMYRSWRIVVVEE